MYVNIITACIRTENLHAISKSIKAAIPDGSYSWLVVFDYNEGEVDENHIPDNCEALYYTHPNSQYGMGQRKHGFAHFVNKGVSDRDEYIYQLDDDTIMYQDFYKNLKSRTEDLITMPMFENTLDKTISFTFFGEIEFGCIDAGNYIFKSKFLPYVIRHMKIHKPQEDSNVAKRVKRFSKSYFHLKNPNSIYNYLRPEIGFGSWAQ